MVSVAFIIGVCVLSQQVGTADTQGSSHLNLSDLAIEQLEPLPNGGGLQCLFKWQKGCTGSVLAQGEVLEALQLRLNGTRITEHVRLGARWMCHPTMKLIQLQGPGVYTCIILVDSLVKDYREITIGINGNSRLDEVNTTASQGSSTVNDQVKQETDDTMSSVMAILVPLLVIIVIMIGVTVSVLAVLYYLWKKHAVIDDNGGDSPSTDTIDGSSIGSDAVYIEVPGIFVQPPCDYEVPTSTPHMDPEVGDYEVPTPIPRTDSISTSQAVEYEVPVAFSQSYENLSGSHQSINEEAITGYLTTIS